MMGFRRPERKRPADQPAKPTEYIAAMGVVSAKCSAQPSCLRLPDLRATGEARIRRATWNQSSKDRQAAPNPNKTDADGAGPIAAVQFGR
jgi:hypothetical protein